MIQSMTGYGKSELQLPTKKITIEIKSLNSKNLDINTRVPACYKDKELIIRKIISPKLIRGKVDFSIYIEETAGEVSTTLNKAVVLEYINQLKEIVDTNDEVELMKMAVRMPDVLKTEREEIDEKEWEEIEKNIKKAVEDLTKYRTDEAKSLENDFKKRIKNIKKLLLQVENIDPDRIKKIKDKLLKAITELKADVDKNRFEQELIYYSEKLDINEETVRLKNHLDYFIETLNSDYSEGKKLGFIVQEIGREVNTIGSKANYAPMQKIVVQMKDELEKIKEQILNVL